MQGSSARFRVTTRTSAGTSQQLIALRSWPRLRCDSRWNWRRSGGRERYPLPAALLSEIGDSADQLNKKGRRRNRALSSLPPSRPRAPEELDHHGGRRFNICARKAACCEGSALIICVPRPCYPPAAGACRSASATIWWQRCAAGDRRRPRSASSAYGATTMRSRSLSATMPAPAGAGDQLGHLAADRRHRLGVASIAIVTRSDEVLVTRAGGRAPAASSASSIAERIGAPRRPASPSRRRGARSSPTSAPAGERVRGADDDVDALLAAPAPPRTPAAWPPPAAARGRSRAGAPAVRGPARGSSRPRRGPRPPAPHGAARCTTGTMVPIAPAGHRADPHHAAPPGVERAISADASPISSSTLRARRTISSPSRRQRHAAGVPLEDRRAADLLDLAEAARRRGLGQRQRLRRERQLAGARRSRRSAGAA